jgi:hypothetical protein
MNVPLVENTIIKSDHKCDYACNAFRKVHFYGENDLLETQAMCTVCVPVRLYTLCKVD